MAELVYALVLGTSSSRIGSSSLPLPTKLRTPEKVFLVLWARVNAEHLRGKTRTDSRSTSAVALVANLAPRIFLSDDERKFGGEILPLPTANRRRPIFCVGQGEKSGRLFVETRKPVIIFCE